MVEIEKADGSEDYQISFLRQFTSARIGIGSSGAAIPTKPALEFKMAHAHARDAVYSRMDTEMLTDELIQFKLPVLALHSKATNREQYLQRPDMGRSLDELSSNRLADQITNNGIVIIIADGLSAAAINKNVLVLLKLLIPRLTDAGYKLAPICLVEQGRVAIGDEIAAELGASFSVMLIGERPGLSSADSMGAYLTYQPKPGLTDDARNCVSNIRTEGLALPTAADKIFYLIQESLKRKLSGVWLKDNQGLLNKL
ncbi:ethanolamine ammonia-lyase subunit EutC [Mucilaginibacter segetis]|uniref:Ethanolamine ammonia-lyase small subunit n=1 Tax=Mucilaginibacter segetis TaxID=2793071 RepID=A0A934PU04_9SPHI|nr:ethanolamine ammonia-lyase subunit EutC [Mucilaginibacter segetis]MBK0380808.1 ethanolamine ammonia-lyase subunit EutC [Mucilaginibacter segetis]